jgi:hypothetical protein
VNQLLPCLNNYASFKLIAETLNDDHNNAGKQNNGTFSISHIYEKHRDRYFLRKPIQGKNLFFFI